ncbi:sugar transporter, partial [Fusarium albosuccineum]
MANSKEQFFSIGKTFNKRLTFSVALIAISQFNFGFDQQAYSTTQAMDHFERQFGSYDEEEGHWTIPPYELSLLNSLPYLGFIVGLLAGSEISARYGRRLVMFVMSIYALCTAAITFSSRSFSQILAARILNYAYVGMELAVVPVFQSEIVPKQVRGLIVETYQLMLYFGGLIMSIICFGTQKLNDDRQWKIPFGLFFIIPSIVATGIWFIPEVSPRWLLWKGREEEAIASLRELRDGCFSDDEIKAELDGLRIILAEEEDKGTFMDLWKPINLKRSMITIGINFFLQLTGNIFANKYGTVYIKSLGSVDPFTMTVINQLVNLSGVVVSMSLVDRIGRRPLLLLGSLIQLSSLYTMAGLGVGETSAPIRVGIVAMLTVFGFGFSVGWAPVSHILSAEIPPTRLRDMTYRTASAVNILVQFAISFSIPYLLDKPYAALGSKVGFIFGTAAIFAGIFAFFCVPECNGRTLEEIDQLFRDSMPMRQFKNVKSVTLGDQVPNSSKIDDDENGKQTDVRVE